MASGESRPLLGTSDATGRIGGCGDISKWELPEDEEEVKKLSADVRHHLKSPEAWMLVLMNMGMCFGYTMYLMTSWLYCAAVQRMLFPHCGRVWIDKSYTEDVWAVACKFSILAFWGLPLVCCLLVLSVYYRNVIQAWLYFEMMSHRIHLDYSEINFFRAIPVRAVIIQGILGISMYWFYKTSFLLSLYRATYTVPYWFPIVSFMSMFYAHWDLKKTQLVSMANMVEDDLDWARGQMERSYMVRDYVAAKAWLTIKKKRPRPRTSTALFRALAVECNRMELEGSLKPSALQVFEVLSSRYWVNEILEELEIDDARIKKFRWWFKTFNWFVKIMMVLLIYIACVTIFTVLEDDIGKPLLGEYSWYFSVRPLSDQAFASAVGGGHRAVPATSTSTAFHLPGTSPSASAGDIAVATWKLGARGLSQWSLRRATAYPHPH